MPHRRVARVQPKDVELAQRAQRRGGQGLSRSLRHLAREGEAARAHDVERVAERELRARVEDAGLEVGRDQL